MGGKTHCWTNKKVWVKTLVNTQQGRVYLQAYLLVHSDGPVAERYGVAEAGLSLDRPLGHVHDDLRALGAGVKEQRGGGQASTWLYRQAALRLVVAPVGCCGKRCVQRICVGKDKWLLSLGDTVGGKKNTLWLRIKYSHLPSRILSAHVTSN